MRSIHEYTAEFMRLVERNDLRENEGQWTARYLEGLKPHIRDKIGVQVNLHEAKNMTLRAKFMSQDRGRYESSRRNFSSENSRALVDNEVTVREMQPCNEFFKKDKVAGKQKVVDTKEAPKAANLYARPTLGKCFKCNQPGHRSSDYPLRRAIHLAEGRKRKKIRSVVNQIKMEKTKRTMRRMLMGRTMW